jgi:hypothetical protein
MHLEEVPEPQVSDIRDGRGVIKVFVEVASNGRAT